jgi:3-hydroxyisobutyrate dehydrogenase-like beta-hydroxyacid dehydrogenase
MAKEIDGKVPMIGFIGVGPMGGKMVRWLLEAGYPVLVSDLDQERLAAKVKEGALAAQNNVEVVKRCDIVMTSLPLSEVWVKVAENDFLPNARPGQIFMDMGTVTPPETRRLYTEFGKQGAHLIDSPVSNGGGGPDSKLFIFVAGDKDVVDRVWPIYEVMGVPEHIVYCGPSGNGQIVKGVNQLNIGLVQAAILETLAFGVRAGIEPEVILKAIGEENKPGSRGGGLFWSICQKATRGQAEGVVVKHGQLLHYIKEAHEKGFALPLTETLFNFLKDSPETIKDANRMSPSFWHELLNR